MIFTDASPRRVEVDAAVEIGAAMRRRVEVVGVFLNAPLDEVVELADLCSLTALQLHGDEGPTFCGEAGRRTGCKVIKAARVRDRASVQALRAFRVGVDYHLLDTYADDAAGGTGRTFQWELAKERGAGPPIVLSGASRRRTSARRSWPCGRSRSTARPARRRRRVSRTRRRSRL